MKSQCGQAAAKAIGRQLTKAEEAIIEERLSSHMRQMARNDRDLVLSMTKQERVEMAADRAAKELIAETARKASNKAANVVVKAKMKAIVDADPLQGVDRIMDMVATNRSGSGIQSLESQSLAIRDMGWSHIVDTVMAANPDFLRLFDTSEGTKALHLELYGMDSGNAAAKAGAKAFTDTAEQLRQRFNRAGGNVGKLENWGKPNHHSAVRMASEGMEAWVSKMLTGKDGKPLIKMSQYVNEDGSLMSIDQVTKFLEYSYRQIVSDGSFGRIDDMRKAEAKGESVGGGGKSSTANRNSSHRQIHFEDAEAEAIYWQDFGEKSMLDVMVGHITSMSRDVALIETFGPDAMRNFEDSLRYAEDTAKAALSGRKNTVKAMNKISQNANNVRKLFEIQSGSAPIPAATAFSNVMKGIRSLQMPILGSATITSMSDYGTSFLTAKHNHMQFSNVIGKELDLYKNPKLRDAARRRGLGLDTMMNGFSRLGEDGFSSGTSWHDSFAKYSQKFASATMKASFLGQLTDIRRQAFSMEFMDVLGKLTRKPFDSYKPEDIAHLVKLGVTREDWAVWNLAQLDDVRGKGDTLITADNIYRLTDEQLGGDAETAMRLRDRAATKLLGIVQEEAKMAIIEPGLKTQLYLSAGKGYNPVLDEVVNSFWQFKSFGLAMIFSHMERMAGMPSFASKAGYAATLTAATTIMGALSMQLNNLIQGKDPQDMTTPKFWGAAFMKGGSFGIYGDFLFGSKTKYNQGMAEVIMGPTASFIGTPIKVALEEAEYQKQIAAGDDAKEPDSAAKMLRWARPLIPGSTLFYIKGAFDHMVFHDMQEMANPGYLNRMKRRIKTDTGQQFWWEPGESVPERAPDIGAMFGAEQ